MTSIFPFLAAMAMLSASPLLIKRAKFQVELWMSRDSRDRTPPTNQIPDYLAPPKVLVYVEYAADIGQIVPTIALTGIGVLAALPESTAPTTAAALTLGIVLALVIIDAALLSVSPDRYVARKFVGLSAVPLAGIAVNLLALMGTFLIDS